MSNPRQTALPDPDWPALVDTARALVAAGKGLLAMDESPGTCNRRFASLGIAQTGAMRGAWRELLLGAPGLAQGISGVILCDETLQQNAADGRPLRQLAHEAGLIVGIKVDTGAQALAGHTGERVTEGLDGLRERLRAYAAQGTRFAKWRGVIAVDAERLPSPACMAVNAQALARYAALCQEAGLVPVIEPEVLMDGAHTAARCQAVTEALLHRVFDALLQQGVVLEAVILKPNMVVAGLACSAQATPAAVAAATLQALRRSVPAAVPGIVFLSGGQSGVDASRRLNALHQGPPAPWPLSFSFARALQHPALDQWAGQAANRAVAQAALLHRVRCNSAALRGQYSSAMEGA